MEVFLPIVLTVIFVYILFLALFEINREEN